MAMLPSIPEIAKQVEINKGNILLKANISDIPNLIGEISKSQNGWCKLANGLIVQWGLHKPPTMSGLTTITLPISFSSTNFSLSYAIYEKHNSTSVQLGVGSSSSIIATCVNNEVFTFRDNVADGLRWIAIGY